MNAESTREIAQQAVVEYLKKWKSTEKVDVATVERKKQDWVIRGTCPIDMEGHPWAEKFEVIVDSKGKIKRVDCGLL